MVVQPKISHSYFHIWNGWYGPTYEDSKKLLIGDSGLVMSWVGARAWKRSSSLPCDINACSRLAARIHAGVSCTTTLSDWPANRAVNKSRVAPRVFHIEVLILRYFSSIKDEIWRGKLRWRCFIGRPAKCFRARWAQCGVIMLCSIKAFYEFGRLRGQHYCLRLTTPILC